MLTTSRASCTARDVFDDICVGISDRERKGRLTPIAPKVESAAHDYELAGAAGAIHSIVATAYQPYGHATRADLVWLYDQRLVNSTTGRAYYRSIRDGNSGRCALCNLRPASTLDHHLPKAEHPIFAVTPDNLLPACKDCNTTKLASLTPTLNTYFDDLGVGPWLEAAVASTTPATVNFMLIRQHGWSADLAARAQAHFDLFGLAKMYTFEASRQVAGIRKRLGDLAATVGPAGIRMHLMEEADSWVAEEQNSWEAAMYLALARSDWFCDGGHALV